MERQLDLLLAYVQRDHLSRGLQPVDEAAEAAEDRAAAQRVTTVLRREQRSRDGRPVAETCRRLADRLDRHWPVT